MDPNEGSGILNQHKGYNENFLAQRDRKRPLS